MANPPTMGPFGSGPSGMNVGAIISAFQDTVRAINTLNQTLASIFPTATASTSTSANAGAASALPATPEVYIAVTVNGVQYKIPAYLP